ncbi:hypothetical protein MMC20_003311 [Loxospora ochrophaea]|nr:hypothetical protein [Loxospora ochrophaea]
MEPSSKSSPAEDTEPPDDNILLPAAEAEEEISSDGDPDQPMDSDPENDSDIEIPLQNDSIAHFSNHTDSVFTIASHPLHPSLIATGSGDHTVQVFSLTSIPPPPVLPTSYQSNPAPTSPRSSLPPLASLPGHTDSVTSLAFSLPSGSHLFTAGLDGQLRVYAVPQNLSLLTTITTQPSPKSFPLLASATEVPEINFLASCPNPLYPNTVALGASDGSVWVYTLSSDPASPLQLLQAYFVHSQSCTAGSWSPDGSLLATVSEDGSLYVWDVFGTSAAKGVSVAAAGGQAVLGLTGEDARFRPQAEGQEGGGWYCVEVEPGGAFVVVGGEGGNVRVVGLPRLNEADGSATKGLKGGGAKNKNAGGKKAPAGGGASSDGQAGQILASLQAQSESVETLSFSRASSGSVGAGAMLLLAAGSVDGSIAIWEAGGRWGVRRHIRDAHEAYAVVKVEWAGGWELLSCGMDGAVRRWDVRSGGGSVNSGQGLVREWKGHRGEGEGGGVLGFVQVGGRIVTAGDDGVSLVFGG